MAESLGDFKITASTDKEAKALIAMAQGKGAVGTQMIMGGAPGKEKYMISGKAPAAAISGIAAGAAGVAAPGYKYMARMPMDMASATGVFDRLKKTFTMKNMKDINKSLFMLQMSSLGVVFSFANVINSLTGLFAGLEDLGTMISTGAIGTAFAGIATGGTNVTDIAGVMGVTTEDQTAAWAGFTAIISQFKALFDALAVKVLTPEMVSAILAVIDALANQLAKPEVAKAIQEIIIAVLNVTLALIPLLPIIASVVNWLGDSGLLGVLVLILVAAEILLPTLAYLQFIFTALMTVVELVSAAAAILGVSFIWIIAVIAIVIVVIDFLYNVFVNLSNGMSLLDAVTNAFGQTVSDVVNFFINIINQLLSLLGQEKIQTWSTSTGYESEAQSSAQTIVNNYSFNKNVGTSNTKDITDAISKANASSLG